MKLHFNWLAAKTHSLCRCKSIHNAGWRKLWMLRWLLSIWRWAQVILLIASIVFLLWWREIIVLVIMQVKKQLFCSDQNISVIEGKSSIKQRRSRYQHESSLPGVTCTTPDYTLWGFGIDLNTDVAPILPDHNPLYSETSKILFLGDALKIIILAVERPTLFLLWSMNIARRMKLSGQFF